MSDEWGKGQQEIHPEIRCRPSLQRGYLFLVCPSRKWCHTREKQELQYYEMKLRESIKSSTEQKTWRQRAQKSNFSPFLWTPRESSLRQKREKGVKRRSMLCQVLFVVSKNKTGEKKEKEDNLHSIQETDIRGDFEKWYLRENEILKVTQELIGYITYPSCRGQKIQK